MRTILIIGLCWSAGLEAQTFDRNYGLGFPNEEHTASRSVERNGTIYTMYRQRRYNVDPSAYLVFQATNADGDTLFTRTIEDALHPYTSNAFESSLTTSDFFGCGLKQNTVSMPFTTSYLVRYTTSGDTAWYREYMNSDSNFQFLTHWAMDISANDDVAVLGLTTHDTIWPYNDEPAQLYLMKTGPQGDRLWDRTYGDPDINENCSDLIGLPDGGYLIVGYYQVLNQWFTVDHVVGWMLRTDADGEQLWYQELSGSRSIAFVSKMSGDHFLIGGGVSDTCCGIHNGGFIAEMDADGELIWEREYYRTDSIDQFWDGLQLADGRIVVCGETKLGENNDQGGWVFMADPAGYQIWSRTINKTPGYDTFTRITACSDGGILLTGQAQRDQLSDVWLVKLDSNGCDSAGCPLDIHTGVTPVVTSSEDEKSAVLAAMPNPFSGSTVLRYSVPDHCGPPTSRGETHVTLEVRDALGRVVRTERLPGATGDYTFSGGEMRAGVYSATLLCASVPCATVCLVVER
jgi:hypothetical protein